jgi:hypothetical protein
VNTTLVKFTSNSTVGNSSITDDGTTVTIGGNLTVSGTTTTINSTTLAIGDNIIQLNGTGATNAGLVVRDATAGSLISGSLLWDTTNDKWIAGPLGSELEIVTISGTQTLTNKTINGSQLVDTSVSNTKLASSTITIAGNSTALGGSITAATILTSTGIWSGSAQLPSGVVSGSAQTIANLPSGTVSGSSQITGIGNSQLTNSSFYIGTTTISLGRATAAQTLTGVSIDGNAGTVTNGVYTTGAQTISGIKTFSGTGAPFMKWSNTTSTDYLLAGMYDDLGSQCVWIGLGGRTQTFTSYGAYSQNGLSINQDGPTGILNIANRGTQKRINLNTGTEGAASFTTLRIDNQTVSVMPDYSGGTLNVNGNMTFTNQGSKITFGDSTSGNPSMIGEGLVDTYGTDSDFISLYARSSFRIFTTATNERARFDTNGMNINGTILPGATNSYNLGSATYGWANIYTNDLHLSNMNKPKGNDIDGTSGDWTIQEGAENLYIINNNNGEKYKILLEKI